MTEEFLSFMWRWRLFDSTSLYLDDEKIEVINPGEYNRDAGPDFFNAKLKIGGTIWGGNVEIHVKATDWNQHHHDANPAFDNVILQVTAQNDLPVYTSKGRKVPTVVLSYNPAYYDNYESLMSAQEQLPCADHIKEVNSVLITSMLGRLGVERLQARTFQIGENLNKTTDDWEESFYRQLARGYGFHVNSQPFESLAQSIPFIILKKYAHQLHQLEAILFGQAGLLHDDYIREDYFYLLKKEYEFLRTKHNLKPIEPHLWKFMRLRPGNFPTIRIAQFASLIHNFPSVFSIVMEAESINDLVEIMAVDVSEYWRTHYTFGNLSHPVEKRIGQKSAKLIVINTIAPFYFAYGKQLDLPKFQDKAMKFLEDIEAEKNSVLTQWELLGIIAENAFESQALLQLKSEYCDKKLCLDCGIGVKIIRRA